VGENSNWIGVTSVLFLNSLGKMESSCGGNSNATSCPEEIEDEEEEAAVHPAAALLPLAAGAGLYALSLLTLVGNAMVVHAIRTERRLQTVRRRAFFDSTPLSASPIVFELAEAIWPSLSRKSLEVTRRTLEVENWERGGEEGGQQVGNVAEALATARRPRPQLNLLFSDCTLRRSNSAVHFWLLALSPLPVPRGR